MPPVKLGNSRSQFVPDAATVCAKFALLPVSIYVPGETVIAAGEVTGKLLFLRQGSVEIVKRGTRIACISEPGAVFGDLAALLDQPHTADVRALERSEFHVADAAKLLASDPTVALHIAGILAARLDAANDALVGVKHQLEAGTPRLTVGRSLDEIAGLLGNVEAEVADAEPPGSAAETATQASDPAPPGRRGAGAPTIPDSLTIGAKLALLPVVTCAPGERVIAAGAATGKLLFLKRGLVEVVKDGIQIARIAEPGAVFGELAALLDQPHTADARAIEHSEFHVADAATLLAGDPAAALYVAGILAARLDAANDALVGIRHQLEAGTPRAELARTVDRITDLLSNESFTEDVFLDELIPKPWGHEYRIYADSFYDVWKLALGPGKSTSLHYHPRKDTVLMCLGGHGRIQLADQTIDIRAGDHVFIPRGVPHATANMGEDELELVEVEHPRNKFDLVRVQDSYGRASQPYESMRGASETLPGLVEYPGIPGAKCRPGDIYGQYRFTIGKTVVDEDGPHLLLAVPVGLPPRSQGIEVFRHGSLAEMALNESEHCFTICVRAQA